MADVFPFEVEVPETAQGHGYIELQVDTPNPFLVGPSLRGHEFHYSRIAAALDGDCSEYAAAPDVFKAVTPPS